MGTDACPWCEAPRVAGIKCSRCGAVYAKAEALRAGRPADATETPPPASVLRPKVSARPADAVHEIRDAQGRDHPLPVREFWLRVGVVPTTMGIAVLFHGGGLGRFLQRVFLGMPVHEMGHAVTAWLCGYRAVPLLWVTSVAPSRGVFPVLCMLALNAGLTVRGVLTRRWWQGVLGGALLVLQGVGTLGLSAPQAQTLVTFGGDGMGLVLAACLMVTFVGRRRSLYTQGLRWGFVLIGAGAWVDIASTWWSARHDDDAIPYGEIEGVGLSDPTKLVQVHGWSETAMVHRYVVVTTLTLVAVMTVWAWGIWQVRSLAARRGFARS